MQCQRPSLLLIESHEIRTYHKSLAAGRRKLLQDENTKWQDTETGIRDSENAGCTKRWEKPKISLEIRTKRVSCGIKVKQIMRHEVDELDEEGRINSPYELLENFT